MNKLLIPCDLNDVSDGYHTFGELYEHRCYLFVALMVSNKEIAWRSYKNDDGSEWEGWFLAGLNLPTGTITYHLPIKMWTLLAGITTHDIGPKWDGHTSADVIVRLRNWVKGVE